MNRIDRHRPDLLDRLPANVAVLDATGEIVAVNRRWRDFGIRHASRDPTLGVGSNYLEVCDAAARAGAEDARRMADGLRRILAGDAEELRFEYPCRTPQGMEWYLAVAGGLGGDALDGLVVMHFDVTARRSAQLRVQDLQAELAHAARLSTVGQMATELAHEINQPLTAAAGYIHAARGQLRAAGIEQGPAVDYLASAAEQIDRAGRLIREQRRFVAPRPSEPEDLEPASMISDAVALASIGAPATVAPVEIEIPDPLPELHVDRVQIQQVIVNLVRNAMEAAAATPVGEAGRVTVRAVPVEGADGVVITVIDNGPGLPEGDRDALFRPFFTTKAKGLGLGLALARRIVEDHRGTIVAGPAPGGGARFSVHLPAAAETAR
ncbi:MAG: ATP-binding protein [Azospirillaceae bacterium]